MNIKSVIAVIIVAVLIGVLYVVFEKNFTGTKTLSNVQTAVKDEQIIQTPEQAEQASSLISLPTNDPTPEPITGSTDLPKEAEALQMRDYSTYFEELKEKAQE